MAAAGSAAARALAKFGSAPRSTLAESIERISSLDEGALFQFLDEYESQLADVDKHRWQSLVVQGRQDDHLNLYRNFVKGIKRLPAAATDAEIDLVAFPNPVGNSYSELHKLFKIFVMHVYSTAKPKSLEARAAGAPIEYRSMVTYRNSLLFWPNRLYSERGIEPPNHRVLYNNITKALRYMQGKFQDYYRQNKKRKPQSHAYVGLNELRQLIDHEMATTFCIDLSEEHALTWCIGRITTVRPGSLGTHKLIQQYLKWKDIEITRGDEPGKFKLRLLIASLKTDRVDPEANLATGRLLDHVLEFYIDSPVAENLIFSIAHRLLIMALRRKLLAGISTVDELMNGNQVNIQIKKEHLNDPVLYRGGARGLKIDPPYPISAKSLTQYLGDRGFAVGYRERITFYSIRKRTATDLVPRIGVEATRELMGHAVLSRTLERYYLNTAATLDVTAAALDQNLQPGQEVRSQAMVHNLQTLAINRLSDDRLEKLKAAAINVLARQMMDLDPHFPQDPQGNEMKNYKRRIRAMAAKAILEEEHVDQAAKMTTTDLEKRKELVEASNFQQSINDRATQMLQSTLQARAADQTLAQHETADLDEGIGEEEDVYVGEDELVDEAQEAGVDESDEPSVPKTTIHVGAEEYGMGTKQFVPYVFLAKAMFEHMLDPTFNSTLQWSGMNKTCPLCQADETIDDEQKAIEYRSQSRLTTHMMGNTHSEYNKWRRRMTIEHDSDDPDSQWECPYGCEGEYASLNNLIFHIKNSTAEKFGLEHDESKTADGWYEPEFQYLTKGTAVKEGKLRTFKRVLELDELPEWLDQKKKLRVTVAHERPGVVYRYDDGSVPNGTIPPHLVDLVRVADGARPWTIPPHLAGLVRAADSSSPSTGEIPDRFKNVIRVAGPKADV